MQIPEEREAFLKLANYSLVKHTDMMAEVRDEAVDICMNAAEKFPGDLSKCTQVSPEGGRPRGRALRSDGERD